MNKIIILFLLLLIILVLILLITKNNEHFNSINKNDDDKLNIIVYAPPYKETCGGCIVLYYLANLIKKEFPKYNVYVFDTNNRRIKNNIFNNYLEYNKVPKNNITIYPEITNGNPLNSPKCVRYILCELGKHCPKDIYKSWNKEDLIFHHSSFNSNLNDKINPFSIIYINPIFKELGYKRNNTCFTIRKAHKFYKKLDLIHPKDSIEIKNENHNELLEIFKKCKYFYCYDPYTGLSNIALLCGCIPIIPKLDGVSETEYIKSKAYCQYENISKLPGYSYGIENVEYAKKTLKKGQKLILSQLDRNNLMVKKIIKNIMNPNYKENNEKYYFNKIETIETFDNRNQIIYIKTPKTGGTSLVNSVKEYSQKIKTLSSFI